MAKKFNSFLIGIFILGAIVITFFTLLSLGMFNFSKKAKTFVLFFEESVNGLTIDSDVKYRGVSVGHVEKILIRTQHQNPAYPHIPVLVHIHADFWGAIESEKNYDELRGQLQLESLITGLYYIELDYVEDPPEPLKIQIKPEYNEIYTVPSPLAAIGQRATTIVARLASIDFEKIGEYTESILADFDKIDFVEINYNLKNTLIALEQSSEQLNHLLSPESTFRYRIENTLEELEKTSRSVQLFMEYIERNPRALISGKPKEDK